MEKRGLSDIVTNVLIILIVLVAVGILWTFVSPLITNASQQLSTEQFSTNFEIVPSSVFVDEDNSQVDLTVRRNIGGGDSVQITKLNIIFQDANGNSYVAQQTVTGFNELEAKRFDDILYSGQGIGAPVRVSVAPVFMINNQERQGPIADIFDVATGQSITPPSGSAECGNPLIEPPEECEGTDLNGQTCGTQGFTGGGTLGCYPEGHAEECTFDTTACISGGADTEAPVVTLASPASGSMIYGPTGSIGFTITDNIGVTSVVYNITPGGIVNQPLSPPYQIPTAGLPEGLIIVSISARDAAGNTGTALVPFTIASTVPANYIGYWRFNPDFRDESPNNLHGAPVGNAQVSGNTLLLDGTGDWVNVSSNPVLNLSTPGTVALTYSAWVKATTTATGYIMGQGGANTNNQNGWNIRWTTGTDPRCRFGNQVVAVSGPTRDDSWHLITCRAIFDGTNYLLRIDYDAGAFSNTVTSIITNYSYGAPNLRLGQTSAATNSPFTGYIDDITVYKTYLSDADLTKLHFVQNIENFIDWNGPVSS